MSRYYKHKPYWARPEDWVTRKPSGAKQTGPRVLETTRSPSGEWAFNGKEYTAPARDDRGFRKGTSVPNTRPSGMAEFSKRNMMKQRMAAMLNKANIAMAIADNAQGIIDYGWDDFWEGKAPPPFDFLNRDIPPEWLPTKTPGASQPLPEQSTTYQGEDGTWYAIPPSYDFASVPGGYQYRVDDYPQNWPPPGHNLFQTHGEIKNWEENRTGPPWDVIPGSPDTSWELTVFQGSLFWHVKTFNYARATGGGIPGEFGVQARAETLYVPYSGSTPPGAPGVTGLPLGVGATEQEALNPGTPSRTVMTPINVLPPPYEWQHPYVNILKQMAGTRIVDIPGVNVDLDPVGHGGQRVIMTPGGPPIRVPTKVGEPPHPPGNGTKERKRLVGGAAFFITQKIFHGITEYQDLLDAIFDALPADIQKQFKKMHQGPIMKSAFVWTHLDKVDIGDAIVNIAWNQFEDYVIGRGLFGMNKKAAQARGDRYAFRSLNSANGLGNLDALGEAYGEFSKEYVNPQKDDLKRFLSERFGL